MIEQAFSDVHKREDEQQINDAPSTNNDLDHLTCRLATDINKSMEDRQAVVGFRESELIDV